MLAFSQRPAAITNTNLELILVSTGYSEVFKLLKEQALPTHIQYMVMEIWQARPMTHIGLRTPNLLVDLLHGEVQGDDFVTHQQLHPCVVLQQSYQLAV